MHPWTPGRKSLRAIDLGDAALDLSPLDCGGNVVIGQPHRIAAPATKPPHQNAVQYLIDCLEKEVPLEGPVSLRISRIGQEIVDAAVRSAKAKRTVRLDKSVMSDE